jgi:hypothetical protein
VSECRVSSHLPIPVGQYSNIELGQLVVLLSDDAVPRTLFLVVEIRLGTAAEEPSQYLIRGFRQGPQYLVGEHEIRGATNLGERASSLQRQVRVHEIRAAADGQPAKRRKARGRRGRAKLTPTRKPRSVGAKQR